LFEGIRRQAALMPPHPPTSRAPNVIVQGSTITVTGCLDGETGQLLLSSAGAAVQDGTGRLDVDLCGLTAFTPEGASALVSCRDACAGLTGGLHYLTNDGPGREALLSAFDDHADTDVPA
jgi:hypothetical protein